MFLTLPCCDVPWLQVAAFGKTTLGLTYSLVLGEAVLSPAIPSVAARAGGIFFPLAKVCMSHLWTVCHTSQLLAIAPFSVL
jgi:hypothetical protein